MGGIPEQIGPYEITREIGRGGMGVVYLARDTKLDRDVAIKSLPPDFADDQDRMARFQREAKLLASLNHANIATVHGLEEVDGVHYLVLEFVEGETLEQILERGPMPVSEALPVAKQIAEAIEAAHDKGVIHRDLKPANIKFTAGDQVKVLDFGLAKAFEDPLATASGIASSPTYVPSNTPTMPGMVLGTAGYLSPEQARGRSVDKRSDIFGFGCVLYEMLSGNAIFPGETVTDSLGATLHKEPVWDALPPDTPPTIQLLLRRCLTKDRKRRLHDIADARVEIEDAISDPTSSSLNLATAALAASGTPSASQSRGRIAIGLVIGILLTVAAGWVMTLTDATPVVRKFDLMTDTETESLGSYPRISPDGTRLAFLMDGVIHVRDLSSFESRALTNTEDAQSLFWSPDSEWIGYLTDDAIYKVALRGGGAVKLAESPDGLMAGSGGGWTTDDRIVVGMSKELLEISARGGEPHVLVELEEDSIVHFHVPSVMVGTDVVLVVEHYAGGKWALVAYDGQRKVEILEFDTLGLSPPVYSPTGHVLYTNSISEPNLWAIGFDPERMEVEGEPFLVMSNTRQPSVSLDGTLVVQRGGGNGGDGEFVWVSADGNLTPIGVEVSYAQQTMLSPDESRIAYSAGTPGQGDVWVHDLDRGSSSRLTFFEAMVRPAAWSPDGQELAIHYLGNSDDGETVVQTHFYAADGSGTTREPIDLAAIGFDSDWARMVGVNPMRQESETFFEVALDDPTSVSESLSHQSAGTFPSLSPDWTMLAFSESNSGDNEVFVTRYPDGTGRWQISTTGGREPRWSADGKTLYFRSTTESAILAVEVTLEPSLRFGLPEKVLDGETLNLNLASRWWPTPDGQRFLAVTRIEREDARPATISAITNWYEEFRKP